MLEGEEESTVALQVLVQNSHAVTPAHMPLTKAITKGEEKYTPATVTASKVQRRGCCEQVTERRRNCRLTEVIPVEQWQGQWMAPEPSAKVDTLNWRERCSSIPGRGPHRLRVAF